MISRLTRKALAVITVVVLQAWAFAPCNAGSDRDQIVVEYDMTKSLQRLPAVLSGEVVSLKITNVNSLTYNVTIDGDVVSFTAGPPGWYSELEKYLKPPAGGTQHTMEHGPSQYNMNPTTDTVDTGDDKSKINEVAISAIKDVYRRFTQLEKLNDYATQLTALLRRIVVNNKMFSCLRDSVNAYMFNEAMYSMDSSLNETRKAVDKIDDNTMKATIKAKLYDIEMKMAATDFLAVYTLLRNALSRINDDSFVARSMPTMATGDVMTLKLKIQPNSIALADPEFKGGETVLEIPVLRGISHDFTTGLAMVICPNDVRYSVKRELNSVASNPTDTLTRFGNPNQVQPIVAGYYHLGYKP